MMPRLLDLFCGAGGAAMGYHRAGFEVVGVDINPQPHYPFEFHQADALTYPLEGFDAIHASPPCQSYSQMKHGYGRKRVNVIVHPDLLGPIRDRLAVSGAPYIIENVPGAPIRAGMLLCGTMFGLAIRKHRYFEFGGWAWPPMAPAACGDHSLCYDPWSGLGRTTQKLRDAQGTPWIPMHSGSARAKGITGDLNNAIPPAYTEWIGRQLLAAIERAA